MTKNERQKKIPAITNRDLLPVELNGHNYEFKWDGRCRVCASGDKVVLAVNKMLTEGYSYSSIVEAIRPLATKNITYSSIRGHLLKHVPAKTASIRAIIETRSQRMQQDFIEGTNNLINPYIYAEVMMKKSFDDIVNDNVKISAKDGLEAAKTLNSFIREEEGQSDLSTALNQLSKIISAVRNVVPPEMFDKIINQVQSGVPPAISEYAEIVEEENEDDEEFNPVEYGNDRDDDDF